LALVPACAFSVADPEPIRVASADDGEFPGIGPEQVLSDEGEELEIGKPKTVGGVAGELLVVVGYLGMIVGGILLPLLVL
jgi:hypothetical protein